MRISKEQLEVNVNPFQKKYIKTWTRIANEYPKPTIMYNCAAIILLAHSIDIHRQKEIKDVRFPRYYLKALLELTP